MIIKNYKWDNFFISTDPELSDIDAICSMLAKSYWASTRSRDVIKNSLKNSLCFNLFDGQRQIGIARVITDHATFAYLCDVFIEEEYRGRGLGKWLLECILDYPTLKEIKKFMLATRDAHNFYRKFGFEELQNPEKYMEISR